MLRIAGLFLALLVVSLLAYGPALTAGFVWDDDDWVIENAAVRDPGGLPAIWNGTGTFQYYPMLFTVFWAEHRLWGDDATGYHAVNVVLHACNAFLLALVLRRLEVPGTVWVALLFAVHPVHVESVAWVTELKNVLSGCFYLASLLAFLAFEKEKRRLLYAFALALFAAAMLSKTASATLPVVLALLLLWKNRRLARADLARLAPFLVLAAGLAAVTVSLEEGLIDVVREDFRFSWGQRAAIAARALLFYPQKLVVPYPLIFNYPRWSLEGGAWSLAWPVIAVALLAAALVVLWRRGRRGTVCAVLFYAVAISPALGFFNVYAFRYSFVADHWQYVASIGILVLLVQGGVWLGRRYLAAAPAARRLAGAIVVVCLGMLTWNQTRAYRDLLALWQDTLSKNPDSWIAHHNLALLRMEDGWLDEALHHFNEAIRCKPHAAESYTGRGITLARRGDLDHALEDLAHAIELNPRYPEARLNHGYVLVEAQRFGPAVKELSVFLEANPDYAPAYLYRGQAYWGVDSRAKACADWQRACDLGDCTYYDKHCR